MSPLWNLNPVTEGSAVAEINYNENVRWLEAIATAVVIAEQAAPPGSPSEGDFYIVDASATGAWAGHDREVALFINGAWQFREAPVGYAVYVIAQGWLQRYSGADWPQWVP